MIISTAAATTCKCPVGTSQRRKRSLISSYKYLVLLWAQLLQAPESSTASEFPTANALVIPPGHVRDTWALFVGAGPGQNSSMLSQAQFTLSRGLLPTGPSLVTHGWSWARGAFIMSLQWADSQHYRHMWLWLFQETYSGKQQSGSLPSPHWLLTAGGRDSSVRSIQVSALAFESCQD